MSQDLNKILVFPKKFTLFLYFGISIGLLSFIYYAISGHADLAWSAFHVNFLFWAGVSHGGILFAAAMRITQSSWGRPMMRIFESFGSFIPIVFIFIIFLLIFSLSFYFKNKNSFYSVAEIKTLSSKENFFVLIAPLYSEPSA